MSSDILCSSCNTPLPVDNDFVLCSLSNCKLHYQCAGITEKSYRQMGQDRRDKYKCVLCRNRYSDSTSVKSDSGSEKNFVLPKENVSKSLGNVTLDTLFKKLCDFESKTTDQLKNMVTMSHFSNEIDTLKTAVNFCSDKVDDFTKELEKANSKIKSLESANNKLMEKNTQLENQLYNLTFQVEDMQQYSRNLNIQLNGIPESQGENVLNIVNKLAVTIDEPITLNHDIQAAHRMGNRDGPRPRPIVVRFSNRQKRDQVLVKSKKCRLTTTDFVQNTPVAPVFVNEHLTQFNKNLLYEAKRYKTARMVQYVWVKGAKIYAKESDDAQTRRIGKVADLEDYFGPLAPAQRPRN